MIARVSLIKAIYDDAKKVKDWGGEVICIMPEFKPHYNAHWGVDCHSAITACRALGYIDVNAKPKFKKWKSKWYCNGIIVKSKKMEVLNG